MMSRNALAIPSIVLLAVVAPVSVGCSSGGPQEGRTAAAAHTAPVAQPKEDLAPPETGGIERDPPTPPVAAKKRILSLMPLGEIPREEIELASESIVEIYGWDVDVLDKKKLLASAYYEPRKRYRAEKLLVWLGGQKPPSADMIMGLTAVDISTTKGEHLDWGICGLADMGGPASVVSTFRIKRKLPGKGKAAKREGYLKRLRELVAHEFGHQLGLEHCPNEAIQVVEE